LNVPLAEVAGFAEGRLIPSGCSRRRPALDKAFGEIRHFLLVDDSISAGGAMAGACAALEHLLVDRKMTTLAIYGLPTSPKVDVVFRVVPLPRVFEWNLMHHDILRAACVDIDGVLCADPTVAQNDDGQRYLEFLRHAKPVAIPTKRVARLVTSRLEKYRAPTEDWLARHGVEYDELVMLDLPDAATRRRLGVHGSFKGQVYRDCACTLFIESEVAQARQIATISGKDVLCFATNAMAEPFALVPDGVPAEPTALRRMVRAIIPEAARLAVNRAIGRV
jgi:uncharacterized HAD superfamily protein